MKFIGYVPHMPPQRPVDVPNVVRHFGPGLPRRCLQTRLRCSQCHTWEAELGRVFHWGEVLVSG